MSADARPDVALVAPYPRLGQRHGGHSGVASYTANLAHALTDAGAHVTVVSPVEPGEAGLARDGGVTVLRAFRHGAGALPSALRAARATGAPVIHLQHELFLYGGPAALPGLLGVLTHGAMRKQSRTAVTMHQVVDPRHVTAEYTRMHRVPAPPAVARVGIRAVQRAIGALADAVVVHEPSFEKIIPGAVTVPHGIERVERPADRATARAELGLDGRLVALCFGFVAPYKGLETAGDAAHHVRDAVELVIAGGPHPRLEARHGYARELQQRYGKIARFVGYVPDEDVHRWFGAADVAVLSYPTPHASSGALALALAHGTPMLVSRPLARTCGLPASLAFDTSAELAARLRSLAADPGERARLRDAAAPLRAERDWHSVARRHIDLYRDLTAA